MCFVVVVLVGVLVTGVGLVRRAGAAGQRDEARQGKRREEHSNSLHHDGFSFRRIGLPGSDRRYGPAPCGGSYLRPGFWRRIRSVEWAEVIRRSIEARAVIIEP